MRLAPSLVLLRTQSDERLTALARDGSEPAFTALVERHRRAVLRVCGHVLPEARAEDAAQQTFLAAWRALQRGDEVREVRAWLLRIARNTALNALRAPGYDYSELAESMSVDSAPQAELERREVMRQTLAGLASLPENQREALLRSAVAGVPHAEIARDLGLSDGATRQLVLRARATLRSAASALTPVPLVTWAAGGGATAGTALAAKAVTVAVVGASVVAAPVVISRADKEPVRAQSADQPERKPAPKRRRALATLASPPVLAAASEQKPGSGRAEPREDGRDRREDAADDARDRQEDAADEAQDRREDAADEARDQQEDAADEAQDRQEDAVEVQEDAADEQADALEERQEAAEERAEERADD